MRVSRVIETAEEVRARMKAENASRADIDAKLDAMQAAHDDVAKAYEKVTPAFNAALARQNS
jgi:hypothetical protein